MGGASSKADRSEALRLCKARKRLIKQVIDSRYAFAAAHVDYVQSLRNIGTSLRRFAEAEVFVESSVSPWAPELDKTPSESSYPSLSPSHIAAEVSDSPLPTESPLSPPVSRLSYMISGGTGAVTVTVNPSSNVYVHDGESEAFAMPPLPPPPPPGSGSSWDFFDPTDDLESFSFVEQNRLNLNFNDPEGYRLFSEREAGIDRGIHGFITPELEQKGYKASINSISRTNRSNLSSEGNEVDSEVKQLEDEQKVNGKTLMLKATLEPSSSKPDQSVVKKKVSAKRGDPSEFITHRAKDFLSSIKDIEHRFLRASESGKEVSRMLEANKICIGYFEAKGGSSVLDQLVALQMACCQGKTSLFSHEPPEHTAKFITWKRSASSKSSSSRKPLASASKDDNDDSGKPPEHTAKFITWKRSASSKSSSSRQPLASASKDDNDDSGSDFVEECCMIAGSHSSTLDRLYAWERKLYDEVKASESIRKEYDRKCDQLRHQFAKDLSAQVMDKTRAVVKDLHSRIRVALHAVDSISKRIEKMRDDELLPQLVELVLGLIRMWKAMLECHHAQYITISLAYHAKSSTGTLGGDTHRQIMTQLQDEIECFGLSFANWINSHTSYVEALNGWLQNCILQPQERSKGRRAFSPRRVLAPPIFVLCRNWSAGINTLPSEELNDAIKGFLGDLRQSIEQQVEEPEKKQRRDLDSSNVGESEFKADEKNSDDGCPSLSSIHSSLAKVLDKLTKFSEASLKMYEDIRQKSESARTAYSNYKKPPRSSPVI